MPKLHNFIQTASEFDLARAYASKVFRFGDRRLPNQVFMSELSNFKFLEFDLMLAPRFWEVLVTCARMSGDEHIYVMVSDPAPDTYYFQHFKRYGILRFSPSETASDYCDALGAGPQGSPADALLYVANVVAWFGSSAKWGVWGEREMGVGIAASRDDEFRWPSPTGVRWFDANAALSELIVANFSHRIIPRDFSQSLQTNFLK